MLADSSDRLEQLRGLLNERSEVETQLEVPRLEAVTDSYIAPDHVLDESENFDLEQTVYVNDSQEPPSDTLINAWSRLTICFQLDWSVLSRFSNRTLKLAT